MARILLGAVFAASLSALSSMVAAETGYLDWALLANDDAHVFEDPFREMAPDHLIALVAVVRLQEELDSGTLDKAVQPRVAARIAQKRAALEAAGIDIEWLISQRWVVAERRRAASLAVNTALEGSEVRIGGYLIPAPPTEDGKPSAYLVPERGMCSHMPPPPPNQLLRIETSALPDLSRIYEPVIVTGRLRAVETTREFFFIDGPVQMWSAWTVSAAKVDMLHSSETAQ